MASKNAASKHIAPDKKSQNKSLQADKTTRAKLVNDLRETVLSLALLAKLAKSDGLRLKTVAKNDVLQILQSVEKRRLSVKTDVSGCTVSIEPGKSANVTKISVKMLIHRLDDLCLESRRASKEIVVFIEKACGYLNGPAAEKILQKISGKDVQIVVDELRSKTPTFDLLVKEASIHPT